MRGPRSNSQPRGRIEILMGWSCVWTTIVAAQSKTSTINPEPGPPEAGAVPYEASLQSAAAVASLRFRRGGAAFVCH